MTWHPTVDGSLAAEHVGELKTLSKLPDPAVCRAVKIQEQLVECMVETPEDCPYALAYGCGFFCRHPQRLDIATGYYV